MTSFDASETMMYLETIG